MTKKNLKIGIINNGLGNVGSVCSAFQFFKQSVNLINSAKDLQGMDAVVLAGVGNFGAGMSRLMKFDFIDALNEHVLIKRKPVLGICLGMQLFADMSYENGENKGLGWIKGKVVKLDASLVRVPHIGWNLVKPLNLAMFDEMNYGYFYFMHSYHFLPDDPCVVQATTKYGDVEIVSALRRDNIVGVQFHPEKSQGDGLRFLKNVLMTL